jgi:FKBP-type peptidyl-prolyl cis-trans isomerase FklB
MRIKGDQEKGLKMKLQWTIAFLVGTLLLVNQVPAEEKLMLKSEKEKMSYIIGMDVGKNLKTQPVDIDLNIVIRGIKDAFLAGKPLLTEQEVQEAIAVFQKEMMEKQQALTEKARKEREAFLGGDKKKEGIVTLPSGLQYKVIKPGIGRKPKLTDTVTVHYRSTLIDGTEFYNSYLRGQPETLAIKDALPGLMEALTLMQEGAKWLLFIPPELAYGERGGGGAIGPNAALIFEIELISIQENK